MSYSPKEVALGNDLAPLTVAGVQANFPITVPFPITYQGSLNFVVKIKPSALTVVGTITAKLQTAIGDDWVDSKTVALTDTTAKYIKLQTTLAGDQQYLPLLSKGRIVITNTNAGDTLTIDEVNVLQG